MHNGARAPFVCRSAENLTRKRDNRESYYAYRPTNVPKKISSISFFHIRVSARRKTVYKLKSKRGVLHRDHVARGTSEAVTAGIRAVPCHCSFVPGPFVISYIFITALHHRPYRCILYRRPFPPLFFPSLFPPARTRTPRVPVTVHRYLRPSLNSQEGFNRQTAGELRNLSENSNFRSFGLPRNFP